MADRECCQCNKPIGTADFLESDDLVLHEACLPAWEAANAEAEKKPVNAGPCVHCGKNITDRNYLENGADKLHRGCADAYFAVKAQTSTATVKQGEESTKQSTTTFTETIICTHCSKKIEEKEYLKDGESAIHTGCKDSYLEAKRAKSEPCAHCGKPIAGAFVELASLPGKRMHEACLDPYKRTTRPKCKKCTNVILENSYLKDNEGNFYHSTCT